MHLTVAKVDEVITAGEVYSVTVPTTAGELTILSEHLPLASAVKPGILKVRRGKDAVLEEFQVGDGVLEVTREGAVVLL